MKQNKGEENRRKAGKERRIQESIGKLNIAWVSTKTDRSDSRYQLTRWQITYDRCDFSWRERESCNTSSSGSTNGRLWQALSTESIDRWASVKGTRYEAKKDCARCRASESPSNAASSSNQYAERLDPCASFLARSLRRENDTNYKKNLEKEKRIFEKEIK